MTEDEKKVGCGCGADGCGVGEKVPRRPLAEGFDPGEAMWDRLIDDIAETGGPCLETVEQLVEAACEHDPQGKKKEG